MKYSVLVAGDFPTGNTGLGTVMGEGILPALSGLDVSVMGVNYNGDPHGFEGVKAYPAAAYGDPLGRNRINPLIAEIRPDVVLLFGDLPVIREWVSLTLDTVRAMNGKYVCYYPVDAEGIPKADLLCLKEMTAHATYTNFAKSEIERELSRWNEDSELPFIVSPPRVVGHGVNTSVFYPMETMKAREMLRLDGVTQETVIVLNANRNQPRKRIDLTILGYVEALKMLRESGSTVDLRLYLHMAIRGEHGLGWECDRVFYDAMRRAGFSVSEIQGKLIVTSDQLSSVNLPKAEIVNLIYNACDIGINTAEAEGWGLVTHEHAATGAPQITPRYACFSELWKGCAPFLSLLPSSHGVDIQRCNKRVYLKPYEIGFSIVDLAVMPREGRMEVGREFYRKAVSMQWGDVQKGIREMVDSALPRISMPKRRRERVDAD